jgi:hypothetical protein
MSTIQDKGGRRTTMEGGQPLLASRERGCLGVLVTMQLLAVRQEVREGTQE